jgi:hypothetical protein
MVARHSRSPQMPIRTRHFAIVLAVALLACDLGACGTINENLAAGLGDLIPSWAGGLPADAPPRPGTAKYDEFMRERERKRLEPVATGDEAGQPSSPALDAVH